MNIGILYAFLAFFLWGLFPIYFKALHAISPLEILSHRMAWSLVFIAILLTVRRNWSWLPISLREPRTVLRFASCATLLSANWGIYIWAVNSGRVVEASLGYFINPLANVLLGFVFLHERLRQWQWVAVATATVGVLWLTWQNGAPPWVSLVLGLTFGSYGLLRKTAQLGALEGLALETLLLFPVVFLYLLWLAAHGESGFVAAPIGIKLLLAAAGPVSAIPLLLFAAGARRIPLSLLGIVQYVTPTIQLLLGVLVYRETFGLVKLVGYGAIWAALVIYAAEGVWRARGAVPSAPRST
ncbi:EamA family transporter RarD [Burkholderia glumae]|uniref:EamA family transporter RarD n=1 Tax=Burkholderia glumae TaxID=337 RepID=UPI000474C03E|nr:EamA family transporter RarD [Burkholderia glumae]MCM2544117.1 EamA family transporter RarD [Burkholderia glumae]MCQ0029737.1 EamA family transporter RarD [Burkholderia glumae]MCQ0038534.1 EamA family transporter RarD [Burkholderia glumae]PJO25148.1 EamA family transporter RarD [Burkholderia glumae AU6208]QHE11906.1 EamA family transporter RarD [Burkholderia glumae AU6208]